MSRSRAAILILASLAVLPLACARSTGPVSGGPAESAATDPTVNDTPASVPVAEASPTSEPPPPSITRTAWEFPGDGDRGQIITTPNYTLYVTARDSRIVDRLGPFMEMALDHYRSALVILPPPRDTVKSYLFRDREQWGIKTREMLRGQASDFRNLGRGGFTTGGTAVLYDIGIKDTLSIAAHEGWHQYTQTTFRDTLPLWLEEGIATYMEGFRLSRSAMTFRPWYNWERFGTLRSATRRGRLIDLEELLQYPPQTFLNRGKDKLLIYYAQAWALVHFLREGEDGKYSDALEQVLRDASNGSLRRRLADSRHRGSGSSRRAIATSRLGLLVVLEYFNDDIDTFRREYLRFVSSITRRGAGYAVNRGSSPMDDRE